jgi:AcrR family transcriptional regulator
MMLVEDSPRGEHPGEHSRYIPGVDPDSMPTLPRGHHGLSRDEVAAAQRARLRAAMLEGVAEHGYAATTIGAVLKRARISRQTFYEHFRNKEDCFLAAFDEAAAMFYVAIEAALGAPDDPVLVRLDRVLEVYLGSLAARPGLARVFMIEIYAAGYEALAQRIARSEEFAMTIADTITGGGSWRTGMDPKFIGRSLTGAVSALVVERINAGDTDGLPALRAPILELAAALLDDSGS